MKINYLYLIVLLNYINLNLIKSQCPFSQDVIKGASATFYTSIDNGNCGFEKLTGPLGPGNQMIAALGSKLYQNGGTCGQCYKITNSQNISVTVMATDSCHDAGYCQRDNHFDLSESAFKILSNDKMSLGVLDNLSYVKVPCQVIGNVKIMMKDGSNPYWTAFFIYNSKVTIKKVSIRMSNSNQFTPLTKTSYNYYPTSITGTNFEVKIESIGGEFIYITIPFVESRRVYDTNTQFSSIGCLTVSTPQPKVETKAPSSPIYNSCPNYIQNTPSKIYLNDNDDYLNSNSTTNSISIINIVYFVIIVLITLI